MALTVQDAGNRLLGKTNSTWTVSAGSLPGTVLLEAAKAISHAEQEMREINPLAFAIERHVVLGAPSAIVLTISGSGTTFTVTDGTVPGAGCTIMLSGSSYYNRIATASTTTEGTLVRAHEGGDGPGVSATVYHDCWAPGDGSSYERIIGEAYANDRLLNIISHESELVSLIRRNDFGDVHHGYRTPFTGPVVAAWPESWTAANAAVESRLRFAAMPESTTHIRAWVLTRAADMDPATVFASATRKVSVPSGAEERFFWPLLMHRWLSAPWFRPTPDAVRQIREDYAAAVDKLSVWRPVLGAQPILQTAITT